jgi:hypothetical protein
VGDDERDGQAAEAAGCPWVLLSEGEPLTDVALTLINKPGPIGMPLRAEIHRDGHG